jgi:hypothetical protein
MAWIWWMIGAIALGGALALLLWRPLRRWGGEVQVERAKELFLLQRERIQGLFQPAAAATGKPRGLSWKACTFDEDVKFARDRKTRQVIALVAMTVQFEATEGGDMEGVPAVANLRNASAVFFFHTGQWRTEGKTVFNMNPGEAIEHFRAQYEALENLASRA